MSNEAHSSYDASSMPIGLDKELERLLIFDIDDDLTIFDPPGSPELRAVDKRLSTAFREEQASKGGNRLIG